MSWVTVRVGSPDAFMTHGKISRRPCSANRDNARGGLADRRLHRSELVGREVVQLRGGERSDLRSVECTDLRRRERPKLGRGEQWNLVDGQAGDLVRAQRRDVAGVEI